MATLTDSRFKTAAYARKQFENFAMSGTFLVEFPPRSLLTRNLSTFNTHTSASQYHQVFRHYLHRMLSMMVTGKPKEESDAIMSVISRLYSLNTAGSVPRARRDSFVVDNYEYITNTTDLVTSRDATAGVEWLFDSVAVMVKEDGSLQYVFIMQSYQMRDPQNIDLERPVHRVTLTFTMTYEHRDVYLTRFGMLISKNNPTPKGRVRWKTESDSAITDRSLLNQYHYSWFLDTFYSLLCEVYNVRPTQSQETVKELYYQLFSTWLSNLGVEQTPLQMALSTMRSSFAYKMLFADIDAEHPDLMMDFYIRAVLDPQAKVIASKMGQKVIRDGDRDIMVGTSVNPASTYVNLALSPAMFGRESFFMDAFAHELANNLDPALQEIFVPQVSSPLFINVFSTLWRRLLHGSPHMMYFANDVMAHDMNTMDPSWPAYEDLQEEVLLKDRPSIIHWMSSSPAPHYAIPLAQNWTTAVQYIVYNTCLITYLHGHSKVEMSHMIDTIVQAYAAQGRRYEWMANLLMFIASPEGIAAKFSLDKKRRFYLQAMNFVAMAHGELEFHQSAQMVSGIMNMWAQFPEDVKEDINLRKIRTVTELHRTLAITMSKIILPSERVENPATAQLAKNLVMPDHPYEIVIPRSTKEINNWGAIQHHCLANYSQLAHNNTSIIIGFKMKGSEAEWHSHMKLDKRDGAWYCQQFYQARNAAVPEPLRTEMVNYVLHHVNLANGEEA